MTAIPTAPPATGRWITRPAAGSDPGATSRHRTAGLVLAATGLVLVTGALVTNVDAAGTLGTAEVSNTLALTFATSVAGFGLAKIGIAVVLVGIVVHLWHRADALFDALPTLVTPVAGGAAPDIPTTAFGAVETTRDPPAALPIHRMARAAWLPVVGMGAMALAVGFLVGIATGNAEAGSDTFRRLSAWTQGTMFLGEGLLLSGISLLLGTILASLRQAGGEVQQSLGRQVHTLRMPVAAKGFIALMAIGMMMAIGQFVLYGVAATHASDPSAFAAWTTWLGPFRETALGLLLAGIVLALATIGRVLGFQFARIRHLTQTTHAA